jgi:soluble lytic murein transglycosylase-like protein
MIYSNMILSLANLIGVSGSLLLAICTVESGGNNILKPNDGLTPTFGVCQIKAMAAKQVDFKGRESDLMEPRINIWYAARYLKYQLLRYHGDIYKAISAYNAGSWKRNKGLDKPKNIAYIDKVINTLKDKELLVCKLER